MIGLRGVRLTVAKRPVFEAICASPFVEERVVEFQFFPGFSVQQKQRSVVSLHESFANSSPSLRLLEVSSKSDAEVGVRLSAFNLMIKHDGYGEYSVESAFQASKVFEWGGPFSDLLAVSSRDAKRDPRLRNSGPLIGFSFFARDFPLVPNTYFYDWLYASALWRDEALLQEAVQFDAFTDIEFNPARSINCQARSVAKVVGLWRQGLLAEALATPKDFLSIGYPHAARDGGDGAGELQQSLF